jgi:PHD/YefM family antitoxin component YafN of YafNO toxin-antitoxin module
MAELVDAPVAAEGAVLLCEAEAAVVLSIDDLELLEETLDVLGRPSLMADIREALEELATSAAPVLTKEQALGHVAKQ